MRRVLLAAILALTVCALMGCKKQDLTESEKTAPAPPGPRSATSGPPTGALNKGIPPPPAGGPPSNP